MKKRTIAILSGALLIVALFILNAFSNGNYLKGLISREVSSYNQVPSGNCKDSDRGKNYFLKGTTKTRQDTKTDFCFDAYIVEYYCNDGNIAEDRKLCLDFNTESTRYQCDTGACVFETCETGYIQDDNGECISKYDYFKNQTASGGNSREAVMFAVEEEFANSHTDWKEEAKNVVDYINTTVMSDTNKKFKIDKFKTFNGSDWDSIASDPEYHIFKKGYCGLTFAVSPIEETKMSTATINEINGKNCPTAYYSSEVEDSILNGKQFFIDKYGDEHNNPRYPDLSNGEIIYYTSFYTIIHEMGHALGLAYPEWYFYEFSDHTELQPTLQQYSFAESYPAEAMGKNNEVALNFSPLSKFIVAHNFKYGLTLFDIGKFIPRKAVVRVKKANGIVVPNANVKVFAGLNGCWFCNSEQSRFGIGEDGKNILLQNLSTNSNGEVEVERTETTWTHSEGDTPIWLGKIIKVEADGLTGGAYLTTFDLQKAKILDDIDTYYIDIVLR